MPLGTEEDLTRAIAGGFVTESHFVDLKRGLATGKNVNQNIAKDLAAFAVDGGTLIVGVEELDDGTIQASPQRLDGLAERIDQIAGMIPDPPLAVTTTAIPTESDATIGYLLVHVPASPTAPHQVDGRYIGRGDTTNRFLTDAEVLRLHQRRIADEVDGVDLLEVEFDRDLFNDDQRKQAHLFVIAEPQTARPDMLVHITDDPTWQPLLELKQKARTPALNNLLSGMGASEFSPGLDDMQTVDRRPSGAAMSTYAIDVGRIRRPDEGDPSRETAAELEVNDNGGLRIYSSRFSDSSNGGAQVLFESMAVGFTRQAIALAAAAADAGGYLGNWTIAFGATGLRGTYSYKHSQGWGGGQGPAFGEESYKRATVVTYAQLSKTPGDLTTTLVGPLLRAYRTRNAFAAALTDPPVSPS